MSKLYIPMNTPLIVTRYIKSSGELYEHGPKTYAEAVKDKDLTNSSGTVSVSIYRASDRSPVYLSGDRLAVLPAPTADDLDEDIPY